MSNPASIDLPRDRVFADASGAETSLEGFDFSPRVARVFDDMVTRSVPAYAVLQSLVAQLALRLRENGRILDVGCSTGNTFLALEEQTRSTGQQLKYVGVDSSAAMLAECEGKLCPYRERHEIELEQVDLTGKRALRPRGFKVALVLLTLQFVRPLERMRVLKRIHRAIDAGGHIIMVEKVMQRDRSHNALFIDWYHDYKRSVGYSASEIARKRQALENRLIPYYAEENAALLESAGFESVTSFFQMVNFQGFLARKGGA